MLRTEALHAIRGLIPCDTATYNEIARGAHAIVVADPAEALDEDLSLFDSLAWQNPLIAHSAANGPGPGVRFSDFLSQRELHRLDIYQLIYKPLGVERQLATTIGAPGSAVIGVALNRHRPDFSDDEVAMLDLLRPFLQASHRQLTELAHLQQMLAALDEENSTHAVLLVDGGGTILNATPAAEQLLQAQADAPLPAPLGKWLTAATMNETEPRDHSLIFAYGRRLLRAHLRPGASDQLYAIVVGVIRDSALRLGAQSLGLSRRECQIIELAGSGAPTAEIAGQLAISTRTVQKHLEHIYRKLDASSRADAIQRVLQQGAEG